MPAFLDIGTFTLRAGPVARTFHNDYEVCATGTVQHDRRVYISALTKPEEGKFDVKYGMEMVQTIRDISALYGWTEVIWTRERRDGSLHLARIPLVKARMRQNFKERG